MHEYLLGFWKCFREFIAFVQGSTDCVLFNILFTMPVQAEVDWILISFPVETRRTSCHVNHRNVPFKFLNYVKIFPKMPRLPTPVTATPSTHHRNQESQESSEWSKCWTVRFIDRRHLLVTRPKHGTLHFFSTPKHQVLNEFLNVCIFCCGSQPAGFCEESQSDTAQICRPESCSSERLSPPPFPTCRHQNYIL